MGTVVVEPEGDGWVVEHNGVPTAWPATKAQARDVGEHLADIHNAELIVRSRGGGSAHTDKFTTSWGW